ncbi:MAG: dTDP-glucose 4,6-dehydratase [Candidatus Omnitrophica bacterium]|nr:dTDP-glucose 4,6-dehydratase [Candidatus Omnitrophota bacterium]MDD5488838.1 dTDP-glucose 4,6-dehydratase [Candidatus Omnitrophota bacterium]
MDKKILVTGGCGFIGSHFIHLLLRTRPDAVVYNLDSLSYAGDVARLSDLPDRSAYSFIKADIRDKEAVRSIFERGVDIVVHFAAESHVDNSINEPALFADVNVCGTLNLLNAAREAGVRKFVHISTDEVYGDIENGMFTEDSPMNPSSPYSASKASADLFVKSYARTFSLPAVIIRCSNNYGPWQYPEKFMPVVICNAEMGRQVPIYARGENSREWIYVEDCVRAILTIMDKGDDGEVYNVGSGHEERNIDTAKAILALLGKGESLLSYVKDRPGHDIRYFLDSSKARSLGWEPGTGFDEGLTRTVAWYRDNMEWVKKKMTGAIEGEKC